MRTQRVSCARRMPSGEGELERPWVLHAQAWQGFWVLPELTQGCVRLSCECLCMQIGACWGRSGRLVIYHCSVMGALLLVKEVNIPERYQTPSLLTSCYS